MKFLLPVVILIFGVYAHEKRDLIVNILIGGSYTTYLPCCNNLSTVESLINETNQLELSVQSCEAKLQEAEATLNGKQPAKRSAVNEENSISELAVHAVKRVFDLASVLLELPFEIIINLMLLTWKSNADYEMSKKCCKTMRSLDDFLAYVRNLRNASETCEAKLQNITDRVDDILKNKECPSGFTYYNSTNRCYAVLLDPSTYDEGKERCGNVGGVLVSIRNQDEQTFIQNIANSLPTSGGVCACNRGGSCYTTSGQTLDPNQCHTGNGRLVWKPKPGYYMEIDYTYWKAGEPNCYGGNEHCIVLDSFFNYQWNDYPCSTKTCPICEADPKPKKV